MLSLSSDSEAWASQAPLAALHSHQGEELNLLPEPGPGSVLTGM